MDATDDQGTILQNSVSSLLAKLRLWLPLFLWKSSDKHTGHHDIVRTLVLQSKTDRLIQLLEPFQESPQLLDPHLEFIVQNLSSAFTQYLTVYIVKYCQDATRYASPCKWPLPRAICKILYVLCKIRGQKVISRLLDNSAAHLEPLLDALETWSQLEDSQGKALGLKYGMMWEERYVMLLWLSHLLLAPFDLALMSSNKDGKSLQPSHISLNLPQDIPPIVQRLVSIGSAYLESASKERQAASILVARLALRPDLANSGLQEVLLGSVLPSLEVAQGVSLLPIHILIGRLEFLGKFVISADLNTLKLLIIVIHNAVGSVSSEKPQMNSSIKSSASARRLIIKIHRELAVAELKINALSSNTSELLDQGVIDQVIDQFLNALADKDTTVRIAASKAVSVIASHLDFDNIVQVVDLVLEQLDEDVVLKGLEAERSEIDSDETRFEFIKKTLTSDLNVANVNSVRWHGLILALSQLIYRGSLPNSHLSSSLKFLMLALRFEQRSSLGVSIGISVRDAACFGLWSIARRYPSKELVSVTIGGSSKSSLSSLKSIATALVVAATLDPSGNIRRGASAALQELVGRHPNQIPQGLDLIQVVDYSAVASRSRSMLDIAAKASRLDRVYWDALLLGLFGWRGIYSHDAETRRNAALLIGKISGDKDLRSQVSMIAFVRGQLRQVSFQQIEPRHGLLLVLAEIRSYKVKADQQDEPGRNEQSLLANSEMEGLWTTFKEDIQESLLDTNLSLLFIMRSAFIGEAFCELIYSLASRISGTIPSLSNTSNQQAGAIPFMSLPAEVPTLKELRTCVEAIELCIDRSEPHVIRLGAKAVSSIFSSLLYPPIQEYLVQKWTTRLSSPAPATFQNEGAGAVAALAAVFGQLPLQKQAVVMVTLLSELNRSKNIELECFILQELSSNVLVQEDLAVNDTLIETLQACLKDFTISAQGDVGSHVRIEAIAAVDQLLLYRNLSSDQTQKLVASVCGLAAGRLDKVRSRAWQCIQSRWNELDLSPPLTISLNNNPTDTSSPTYFYRLISLCTHLQTRTWLTPLILEGYVTSAGAGAEAVQHASRSAFSTHAETLSHANLLPLFTSLLALTHPTTADRVLHPTLSFLAYTLQNGTFDRILSPSSPTPPLAPLLSTAQKILKSTNIPKILTAVKLLTALTRPPLPDIRSQALDELCGVLLHRFPKVRNAAADEMWLVLGAEGMLGVDWGAERGELRGLVGEMREMVKVKVGEGV